MDQAQRMPVIEPVLSVPRKEAFADPAWSFEFKYDGFRGILYIEPGRHRFVSKQGKILRYFGTLAAKLADMLPVENAVFDGEIIARDESKRPIFSDLLRRRTQPLYICFDLLWLNGADMRTMPLTERRARMHSVLVPDSPYIEASYAVDGDGRAMFAFMCEHDLEGIVAKRLADPYTKRTIWYKIKNPHYSQSVGRHEFFNRVRKKRTTR